MNILHKLLLLLSLSMSPVITVSAQVENTDFDTFQTAEQYLADFDYLNENSYRLSSAYYFNNNYYEFDYSGEYYIFYCFPIYYEIQLTTVDLVVGFKYYTNDKYQFLTFEVYNYEISGKILLYNYVGEEIKMSFLALDYVGMSQVIEHDKAEKSNSISIYNSFYNFFTGFFPNEVVNEYHGIFTFIIVSFLLFLVFGFVFFLFRVIRRLVGFK